MLDAENRQEAMTRLRQRGLFPQSVVEDAGWRPEADRGRLARLRQLFRSVSVDELASTTAQVATMLEAGLTLEEALAGLLEGRLSLPMRRVLTRVLERLREGAGFSEALQEHPRVFSDTYTAMVRAGEDSGTLDLVMARLSDHLTQQVQLRRRVQSAVAYPAFMLLFGSFVVLALMVYVVPKVTEIFQDLGQALPLPTVLLIGFSDFVRSFWYVPPLVVLVVVLAVRRMRRTTRGRIIWDRMVLSLPVAGPVYRALAVGRFARLLGMLLTNEVELMRSLSIVRQAVGNKVMEQAVDGIADAVREGGSITKTMNAHQVFPPTAVQMVGAGERSGRLGQMFLKVADNAESETESRLAVATSLAEPVLILLLGLVVGFVVMAIMLPIMEMSSLVY